MDNDDDSLGAIGFMFDAEHQKIKKEIIFNCSSSSSSSSGSSNNISNNSSSVSSKDNDVIKIIINTIGDDPGHVQSGQYIWPASIAAGNYFISVMTSILLKKCSNRSSSSGKKGGGCVLELGAGCGLSGLVMSKLDIIDTIIFTDYDHGTLQLLHDNIIINNNNTTTTTTTSTTSNNNDIIQYIDNSSNTITKTFMIDYYKWGNDVPIYWDHYINIIIGADLLYCSDVVEPLILTITKVFKYNDNIIHNKKNSNNTATSNTATSDNSIEQEKCIFILISSFDTGNDVTDEMIRCLNQYGLKSTIIQELHVDHHICKIEHIEMI